MFTTFHQRTSTIYLKQETNKSSLLNTSRKWTPILILVTNYTKIISKSTSIHELIFLGAFYIKKNLDGILNCEFAIFLLSDCWRMTSINLSLNYFQNFPHFCLQYIFCFPIRWFLYFPIFILVHEPLIESALLLYSIVPLFSL